MPVIEGKFQCRICEDIFEAKSGTFTKCKCGESEIEPCSFGYSYRKNNEVNSLERNEYYLEDEFVKLPEDINAIYNEIKKIKEDNGYKYYLHEYTRKGKNGEKFLDQISITYGEFVSTYSNERNEVSFNLRLSKDKYQGDEVTKKRMNKFLNFMKSIENKDVDLTKRSKLYELAEKEDIDHHEEPTGETNVTFYF